MRNVQNFIASALADCADGQGFVPEGLQDIAELLAHRVGDVVVHGHAGQGVATAVHLAHLRDLGCA